MPTVRKRNAFAFSALAILFNFFFQTTKHNPSLSTVNPFAEDPYDAIGSFSVQFVIFLALLSLLRAFRPYGKLGPLKAQEALFTRGLLLGLMAIAVTLLADGIAMLRHPAMWLRIFAGYELIVLTVGLLAGVALWGWLLFRHARSLFFLPPQPAWTRTLATLSAFTLVLTFYPEQLRQNLWGELLTVVVGVLLLFLPLSAFAHAITPRHSEAAFDLLDDLASLYAWLKSALPSLRRITSWIGTSRLSSPLRTLSLPLQTFSSWLNPRNSPRNLILLVGISIGLLLLGAELRQDAPEPVQLGQFLKVAAAYIGLECIGVLTGFAFLAKPLQLFAQRIREP